MWSKHTRHRGWDVSYTDKGAGASRFGVYMNINTTNDPLGQIMKMIDNHIADGEEFFKDLARRNELLAIFRAKRNRCLVSQS